MLKGSYNKIKTTLDELARNNEEWDDDDFGSYRGGKGRNDDGFDKNAVVAL